MVGFSLIPRAAPEMPEYNAEELERVGTEWSSNRVSAIKQSPPARRSRDSRDSMAKSPVPLCCLGARFSLRVSPSFFAARRGSAGDERRTREVQTIDSARRCVGGAALSPGIVAARLLCRCFVTDRKVACLVCTNPTTTAAIVRHVRDYSEERSFDDKPASKVATLRGTSVTKVCGSGPPSIDGSPSRNK